MKARRTSRLVLVQARVPARDAAYVQRVARLAGGSVPMLLRQILRRRDLLGLCGWSGVLRVTRRGPRKAAPR